MADVRQASEDGSEGTYASGSFAATAQAFAQQQAWPSATDADMWACIPDIVGTVAQPASTPLPQHASFSSMDDLESLPLSATDFQFDDADLLAACRIVREEDKCL